MYKATSQEQSIEVGDNQGGQYTMITITLNFQRRALFYIFNFILPCMVISISCLAGFILPANSSEKIGLRKFYPLYN